MTFGATSTAALSAENLTVRYGDKVAVDQVSFSVEPGQIVALLGPNGAGKTTTLKVLDGSRKPTSGTASVAGLNPVTQHREVVKFLGVMPQGGGIYPALRVRESLELFASYYDNPRSTSALSALLGLTHLERSTWRRLSGGEQQRLSLALALVGQPRVVIVDEPTAGVDPEGRLVIREVFSQLREEGVAILMTSHELSEVAVSADTLVFLSHGKVLASGTQASLAKRFDARASFRAAPRLDVVSLSQTVGTDVHEVAPGQYRLGESFDRSALGRLNTALVDLGATVESFSGGGSLEDLYYDLYRTEPPHEAPPTRRRRRGAR